MTELEKRFVKYEGERLEDVVLPVGVKPLVYVVHDESIFVASDGKKEVWQEIEGKRHLLPKSQGRSLMVSEFLCECHGAMHLNEEERKLHNIPESVSLTRFCYDYYDYDYYYYYYYYYYN